MLKQADGSYACVAESSARFTLGQVTPYITIFFLFKVFQYFFLNGYVDCVKCLFIQAKEELLRVIGLQEEQGSSLEFLRRGYKVCTIPFIADRINFAPSHISLSF